MDEFDLALLEAFLTSHDIQDADWFIPDEPELFEAWAAGPYPAQGAHDCAAPAATAAVTHIRELASQRPATPESVTIARDLRDGFMAMMLDGEPPEALGGLIRALPVRLRLGVGSGVATEPAEGGPVGVAATAMLAAQRLAVSGAWPRLRLCRNDDCHWLFYDRSKNGSRVWCSMGACGARAKARAYRARQRAR